MTSYSVLQEENRILIEENARLTDENRRLKAEIAVLKGQQHLHQQPQTPKTVASQQWSGPVVATSSSSSSSPGGNLYVDVYIQGDTDPAFKEFQKKCVPQGKVTFDYRPWKEIGQRSGGVGIVSFFSPSDRWKDTLGAPTINALSGRYKKLILVIEKPISDPGNLKFIASEAPFTSVFQICVNGNLDVLDRLPYNKELGAELAKILSF